MGGIGGCAPKILSHPKFCCAQKNMFQTFNKNKNLPPKNVFCSPNLKTWLRAVNGLNFEVQTQPELDHSVLKPDLCPKAKFTG